jgi:hypothetical protein
MHVMGEVIQWNPMPRACFVPQLHEAKIVPFPERIRRFPKSWPYRLTGLVSVYESIFPTDVGDTHDGGYP